jgi:hypothetical protein
MVFVGGYGSSSINASGSKFTWAGRPAFPLRRPLTGEPSGGNTMHRDRQTQWGVVIATTLLALVFAVPGWAQIYAQYPTYNGAFSSQNDTNGNGNFATVYDNFTLGAGYNLTSVEWIGSYFNPPNQGTITAWTVSFWADAAGQPGALLQSFNVAGNGNETFLLNDNFGDPTFLYGIAVNFNVAAGTQYWLSVVPDLGFPPQWGWETGTGGDGIAYQDFFGIRTQLASDLSFALYGNPVSTVPEPGTILLLGSGLLGLARTVRRKKTER